MALKPLQAGKEPLGQFDGVDSEFLLLRGGEVGTLTFVADTTTDMAAGDVYDGYASNAFAGRPAISRTLADGYRPLFLLDEGVFGYGTMFGVALGGVAGQYVPNPSDPVSGVPLGPTTSWGSGKITAWDKPGLYAVTLDAVAADLAPTTPLRPRDPLYATPQGLLTSDVGGAFENVVVARFVEFSTSGSYVTTPRHVAGGNKQYTQVVIHFHVED